MSMPPEPTLLAVDLGLHVGLALYGHDGHLRWHRSHNFGNRDRMRRGAYTMLQEIPDLRYLVMEGSGPYAAIWRKEAARHNVDVIQISAEAWRPALLLEREQRSGAIAKQTADRLARSILRESGIPVPGKLDHNAAEAILIGLWALAQIGWRTTIPAF